MSHAHHAGATQGIRRVDVLALIAVLTATALARLIPAVLLGVEVSDLSMYRLMAVAVARHQDIYDIPTLYHYTPLSLFAPTFAVYLSTVTGEPFHLVMKMYPLAGDLGTAVLIFLLARRRWGSGRATLAGLAFALNPVSVLITALHGQFMPFSVFFAFWAYYLLEQPERQRQRTYVLSALALGVGIGLRGWPVLLVPFFLRPGVLSTRQRVIYVMLAAFPSVVTLAPYLAVNFAGIQREMFNYQSTPDFGWLGIWRNAWFLQSGYENLPGSTEADWLSRSRFMFLAAYGALIAAAYWKPRAATTADWVIATLLMNYTLLGGVAAQYFGWIIPFLLFRPYYGSAFSLVTAVAMVTFYLTWHPPILLGDYPPPIEYTRPEIVGWYLVFQVVTWAAGLLWLGWFVLRLIRPRWRASEVPEPLTGAAPAPWHRASATLIGSSVLVAGVCGTVALELPYIARSRPPLELPASIVWAIGEHGTEPGNVVAPVGMAAGPSGDLYVADLANVRVQRYSADGVFLEMWPRSADRGAAFRQPSDVTVGSAGDVYVLDAEGAIFRLQPDGSLTEPILLTPLGTYSPRAFVLDDVRQRFYVSDTGTGRILVLTKAGRLLDVWGGEEDARWQFEDPAGLGVDSQGNVFAVELRNSRIRKISPEGRLLAEWLVPGTLYDLAVAPDDTVYVTAADRTRLWLYDDRGQILGQVVAPFEAAEVPQGQAIAAVAPGRVIMATEMPLVEVRISAAANPPS